MHDVKFTKNQQKVKKTKGTLPRKTTVYQRWEINPLTFTWKEFLRMSKAWDIQDFLPG